MIQSPYFWVTLASSAVVYWLIPARYRFGFLACISIGYLGTLDLISVCALMGWVALVYFAAPYAADGRRRAVVVGLILIIFGFLAAFKYVPPLILAMAGDTFATRELFIPLGISYYTFKLVHYIVESAKGNIKDRSFGQFCCYMFLFPIFTAGPIERYDHFLENQDQKWRLQTTVEGLTRIIHGLIKKLVIAEMFIVPLFGRYPDSAALYANLHQLSGIDVWKFYILTFLYSYLDFSAYADIAIGSSRLFGLRIMENFNWPLVALNISDFWKRWHMTLTGWVQHYVYMPLIGITRNPYIATYAAFVVIGLWHEGSMARLSWGLYHATGVAIYATWARFKRKRRWKPWNIHIQRLVGIPITFLFVSGSYVFARASDLSFHAVLRILAKLIFIDLPQ